MMIFIIDSNIIFSALLKEGKIRELLIDSPFILYAPEATLVEIRKHEEVILKKSGLTKDEFRTLFGFIIGNISIVNKEDYKKYIVEAEEIIGSVDRDDIPFIALALAIPNDGIWTEDNHFQKQKKIPIWKTEDIIKIVERLKSYL
mgnify:CR=1 FL=1